MAYLQDQLLDLQHLNQDQDSELDKLRWAFQGKPSHGLRQSSLWSWHLYTSYLHKQSIDGNFCKSTVINIFRTHAGILLE